MKTARFSSVVQKSGRPEIHLLLVDPKKDSTFQRALKDHRVMTVHQQNVGSAADYGAVGFEPGPGQILIFPKSLRRFEGRRIVGIDFGLTSEPPMREKPVRLVTARQESGANGRGERPRKSPPQKTARPKKSREPPAPARNDASSSEGRGLREAVREAMQLLESDKPMAAYQVLKKVAGD